MATTSRLARVAAVLAFPVIGVAFGCAGPVPWVDPASETARAVGLSESIRFVNDGGPVDAADSDPQRLTRGEAVRRAMLASADIQASLAEVRVAMAEARQARLLSNPVLNVSIRFPEGEGSEVIEAGLSQSMAELLRRPARSRAADARLRGSVARVVGEALDLLASVERTYAEAQAADARLDVLGEQMALLDRLLEIAESRRRAGEAGQLDVIGLQARRAALAAQTEQAQGERRVARITLARLVGRPSGAADWELEAWALPPASTAGETEWIELALRRRPEIQEALFELAALGEEVRLASLDPFDDLAAGANLESEEGVSAGPAASVPIPIFDIGQHRRARAVAERTGARHRLTATRRQIVQEVRQAIAAAEAARRAVTLIEQQLLPLQRDRLERIRANYRAGLSDVTDLLLAEQDLLDAESLHITSRRDAAVARADLRRASGGVASPASAPTTAPATKASTTTRSGQ